MGKELVWLIGGEAGQGIMVSGRLFAKAATRAGLYTFAYSEYPSLIRGGHNSFQVRIGRSQVYNPTQKINLLIALNQETFDLHKNALVKNAGIIFDPKEVKPQGEFQLSPTPLNKMAEAAGGDIYKNTIALGASLAAVGGELKLLTEILDEEFGDKGEKVVKANIDAAQAGYDHFKKNFKALDFTFSGNGRDLICLTGNEAIAFGAMAASCKFYCAYPMTPTSSILHFLALHGPRYGMLVKQAEDEIAVINTVIGAGFAGARAMTASSGGGFALMTEGVALAAMTETPIVIVEGQRPAPATGVPTWHAQGDAGFVLHVAHGDFPRIVLAPRSIEECFYATFDAFNIAERFQNPVIILVDKLLCESLASVPSFKTENLKIDRGKLIKKPSSDYKRYKFSDDGVSPRALPGTGVPFRANSDEHDEAGFSSDDAANREKMMAKRMKKLEVLQKSVPEPEVFGDKEAEISLFSWGSSCGACKEAVERLQKEGMRANLVSFLNLNPLPANLGQILKKPGKKVFVEANFSGQVATYIRGKTGSGFDLVFTKDSARPVYAEEIIEKIKKVI